jgi:hypothetical protein
VPIKHSVPALHRWVIVVLAQKNPGAQARCVVEPGGQYDCRVHETLNAGVGQ